MKNSILSSVVRATLLGSTLLTYSSLYSMQLNAVEEDSSDETESGSSEETGQEQTGWGMRPFLASQIAGARALLAYGRRAAEDLVANYAESVTHQNEAEFEQQGTALSAHLIKSEVTDEKTDTASGEASDEMVHESCAQVVLLRLLLLSGDEKFTRYRDVLNRDAKSLLVRSILKNHVLVRFIRARLKPFSVQELEGRVFSMNLNGPGTKMVGSSEGYTARIWDTLSGKCLGILQGHTGLVTSATFNNAGNRILTISEDGSAKIWDVSKSECLHTLSDIKSAKFNPAGDRVFSLSVAKKAMLWDVEKGECIYRFDGVFEGGQFSPEGDRILTVSEDGTARVWDTIRYDCLYTLEAPIQKIKQYEQLVHCTSVDANTVPLVLFDSAGDRIFTGCRDGTAKIWDTYTGACLSTLPALGYMVAQFNPAGDRIVTSAHGVDTAVCHMWDVYSGSPVLKLGEPARMVVSSIKFNSAGNKVVIARLDGTLTLCNLNSGNARRQGLGDATRAFSVAQADFCLGGDTVISVSNFGDVEIWNSSLERLYTLEKKGKMFVLLDDRIIIAHIGTATLWDYGRSFTAWLHRECTLEQALLLHCIYEARRVGHGLQKIGKTEVALRFDFNAFPHLQIHFDMLPGEIQDCLAPFVIRKA